MPQNNSGSSLVILFRDGHCPHCWFGFGFEAGKPAA